MELIERLDYIRENNKIRPNISEYEFANMTHTYPAKFAEIRSGKVKKLSQKTALEISNIFGVEFLWILTGEGQIWSKNNSLKQNKNKDIVKNIDKLCNRLIKIMDKNNLSNGDMAKLTKVSESDFVKISVGKKLPDLDFLNNLKANFDVDIDWLLYGDAEPPTSKKEVSNADKNLPPLTSEQYQKLLKLLQDI